MYQRLYYTCNGQTPAITTNTHFILPNSNIYYREAPPPTVFDPERENLDPGSWGQDGWNFLFAIADGYSQNATYTQKMQMRHFLHDVKYMLPCTKCRVNFASELDTLQESDLESSQTLRAWLQQVRNTINANKEKEVVQEDINDDKDDAEKDTIPDIPEGKKTDSTKEDDAPQYCACAAK